jgi:hypothetical protein
MENNKWKRWWGFYWKTSLTHKREDEIREWIDTLTDEQYQMLNDIVSDSREEAFSDGYESAQEDM